MVHVAPAKEPSTQIIEIIEPPTESELSAPETQDVPRTPKPSTPASNVSKLDPVNTGEATTDGPEITAPSDETSARPSRRARGAVSYAEPSLNTKLRRSTSGMVPAVYPARSDRTSGQREIKTETDAEEPSKSRRRSSVNRSSTGSRRSTPSHEIVPVVVADDEHSGPRHEQESTDAVALDEQGHAEMDTATVQRVVKVHGLTSPPAARLEDAPARASPSAQGSSRRSSASSRASAGVEPEPADDGAATVVSATTARRRSVVS